MWLFYYFDFERNYDVLKWKILCILMKKNINFNKNKTWIENRKFHTQFSRDEPFTPAHRRIVDNYTYFYISKNISLYNFWIVFEIIESIVKSKLAKSLLKRRKFVELFLIDIWQRWQMQLWTNLFQFF